MNIPFRPRLVDALKGYSAKDLAPDLIAGVTVGIVALPLAMAFAIAAGVKPEAGIFTAVIAGFIVSALGGTKVSIGGPTGAFIVILYGIGAKYGFDNLLICTIMAGGLLVTMGVARMGTMIKFIPYPVTMGFTSGIAVLIFSTQIKDFFGLQIDKVPSEFVEKMRVLLEHAGTVQWPTAALAAASLAIILFWPKKWQRRVPGSIAALVLGTAAVVWFNLPVETIGSIGLPGVVEGAMATNGLVAFTFTDTNGNFNMQVTAGQWALGGLDWGLIVHGYVGLNNRGINVSAGATGVTLAYPKATALFYGSVTDNFGNPLPGIDVRAYDNNRQYQIDGYTDANGNYVVGVLD